MADPGLRRPVEEAFATVRSRLARASGSPDAYAQAVEGVLALLSCSTRTGGNTA